MLNILDIPITLFTGGFTESLNFLGRAIQWIVELGVGIGGAWVGIILFTLVLRTVLLPLDAFSKASMRKNSLKMEKMRPQLEKLQKQYQNDKNAYNQKMMELYKKNGYSMLGACLPMIVTMVVFIVVLSAFSSYSNFANVNVYEKMAVSYSSAIQAYAPEESAYGEWQQQADGTYTRTETRDSADSLLRVEYTWTIVPAEDGEEIDPALNAPVSRGSVTVSAATYTVKTDNVLAALGQGDAVLDAAYERVKAEYADLTGDPAGMGSSQRDTLAAEIMQQVGSESAAETYREERDSFFWVKNIWLSDTSYTHPVPSDPPSDTFPVTAYERITHNLTAEKEQANGYFIMIIVSIGTMFLSQFIISKSNKAQNELQTADGRGKKTQRMMLIIMPIIFGIFSFMYSTAFTIYMVVGNIYNILSTVIINLIIDRKFRKIEEREIQEKYNKRIPHAVHNGTYVRNGGKKK